ncbi:MAG TPA: SCO family protein [Rhodanobacter sp.]|jgi:protein SCO1/2
MLLWLPLMVCADVPAPADLPHLVGFDQKLGAQVPMTLHFRDAVGHDVTLAELVDHKPTLLALGYYRCPNLCDLVLQGVAHALPTLRLQLGRDYQVVFISIDPNEKPADARDAAHMLGQTNPAANVDRWHLLTGDQASIRAVAQSVGFRYFHDLRDGQYAHAVGLVVLTGQGAITQYFFGLSYPSDALRLSLVNASHGRLGSLIEQLVLFCCGYDPSTGRYSLLIERMMQCLGVGFVLMIATGLYWFRRRART